MEKLLQQHQLPEIHAEIVSENQFYRICHISKRHAKYLLDSKLVKCRDTGKRTHRYMIESKDVLYYLADREVNPEKYRAPKGYYSPKGRKPQKSNRRPARICTNMVSFNFTEDEKAGLLARWESAAAEYDDLMTTIEASELTGYTLKTIQTWCNKKRIIGLHGSGKWLIPKISLLEFMSSDTASAMGHKSAKHTNMLFEYAAGCHKGAMAFEIW